MDRAIFGNLEECDRVLEPTERLRERRTPGDRKAGLVRILRHREIRRPREHVLEAIPEPDSCSEEILDSCRAPVMHLPIRRVLRAIE